MERRPEEAATLDPRGLIREAYRIEGIGPAECRSIFLDWALGVAAGRDAAADAAALMAIHGPGAEDHPMTAVLRQAAQPGGGAERRGGRRGRGGGT